MDFHLKGIAIGVVFLVLQFIFFKKAKNKYIRLIPLFISLMCLFFCFLLYLGFPPIETTPFSSNEFTGALAMVWCGYAIFGALCVFMFTSIRKIIKIYQIKGKTKTATKTKRNKKVLRILAIILVLILTAVAVYKYYFGLITPYISDLNIVYTPTKPAYRFYHWYWIDIYDYYVFKLSHKEEQIIIQEAENGNWSELSIKHIDKLDEAHCDEVWGYEYKYHKCYICIYDEQNNQIVTDSDNNIPPDRIIFLYDTETNKYYCVFQTI